MLLALGAVILTSLSGVMSPGPMFAVTMAKSMKSPWSGMQISAGHAVVEVPLILLIFLGLKQYLESPALHLALGVLGGGVIAWMGIALFRSRRASSETRDIPQNAFTAGILMSGLNPFFLIWWLTVGSLLLMTFLQTVGTLALPLFILVHWLCDFAWLSLVSFSIYSTRRLWNQKVQEWAFVVLGLGLVYFGGQFIIKAVAGYLPLVQY